MKATGEARDPLAFTGEPSDGTSPNQWNTYETWLVYKRDGQFLRSIAEQQWRIYGDKLTADVIRANVEKHSLGKMSHILSQGCVGIDLLQHAFSHVDWEELADHIECNDDVYKAETMGIDAKKAKVVGQR